MKLAEFYDASTHEKVFINPEHVVVVRPQRRDGESETSIVQTVTDANGMHVIVVGAADVVVATLEGLI